MSNTIGIQDKQINEIACQRTNVLYSYNYERENSFPENTAFHNFVDVLRTIVLFCLDATTYQAEKGVVPNLKP